MSLLVYNHHCLPFSTAEGARERIPEFIRTWLEAKRYGLTAIRISRVLDPSWMIVELAPDYRWETWLRCEGPKNENRDLVAAFHSLATQTASPLLAEGAEAAAAENVDVRLAGKSGTWEALHGAHCLQAPLLGHATEEPWTGDAVNVEVDRLGSDGSLETERGTLMNLVSRAAVERHRVQLTALRDSVFNEGGLLWEQRGLLFPDLVFCPSVERRLRGWLYGPALLNRVRSLLTELDRFACDWKAGKFEKYNHEELRNYVPNLSDESQSVAANPKLAAARCFRLPSRKKERFLFHLKMQDGFRIHYLPDGHLRTVYVGYVGPHLPL